MYENIRRQQLIHGTMDRENRKAAPGETQTGALVVPLLLNEGGFTHLALEPPTTNSTAPLCGFVCSIRLGLRASVAPSRPLFRTPNMRASHDCRPSSLGKFKRVGSLLHYTRTKHETKTIKAMSNRNENVSPPPPLPAGVMGTVVTGQLAELRWSEAPRVNPSPKTRPMVDSGLYVYGYSNIRPHILLWRRIGRCVGGMLAQDSTVEDDDTDDMDVLDAVLPGVK
ncbi:hypothetical protein BJ741DRAFT_644150 [Chytriomyces cf. hyalinus JEL632]|nr:hypothetical protein BJ741DRAFT_644150 [Chytriomyces cf. hyalinus JEL632]